MTSPDSVAGNERLRLFLALRLPDHVLDDLGGGATVLAEDVQARLEALGAYRRENRPWLPHLTVGRFRERPRLRAEPPPMGTFVPSDAAAYLSRLRPGGAEYVVLESVALGG